MAAKRQEAVTDDVVRTSRRVNEALAAYAKDHPDADFGLATDAGANAAAKPTRTPPFP